MAGGMSADGGLSLLYKLADAGLIFLSLLLALLIHDVDFSAVYVRAGGLLVILFYLIAELSSLYRIRSFILTARDMARLVMVWCGVVIIGVLVAFFLKQTEDYSRIAVSIWIVLTPTLMILYRIMVLGLVRYLVGQKLVQKVAIVGTGPMRRDLTEAVLSAGSHLRLEGYYDDDEEAGSRPLEQYPYDIQGDLDALVWDVLEKRIDVVCIIFPLQNEHTRRLIESLSETHAKVYIVPDFLSFNLLSSQPVPVGRLTAFSLYETPVIGVNGVLKRVEDLLLGGLILLLLGLPMLVIALLVRFTSPGPVLFKQRRYGLGGDEIVVWKYRTMTVMEDGAVVTQATRDDQRVTAIGRFLRAWSLDELPQVFNVLGGSMSIVGPRPHAVAHNEKFRALIPGYMLRHRIKPGLTGLAQVRGLRGETDTIEKMERRVRADIEYIRDWSILLDIEILFRTVYVVLRREGNAY